MFVLVWLYIGDIALTAHAARSIYGLRGGKVYFDSQWRNFVPQSFQFQLLSTSAVKFVQLTY